MVELGGLIAGWTFYFTLHSGLANENLKSWVYKKSGISTRYFRLLYVTISLAGLLLLLLLNANISSELYFNNSGWIRYLSLMLTAFGVIVIKVSFREYDFETFVGLKETDGEQFTSHGILSKIRHPIYLGTIIIVIGYFLFSPNLPTLISVLCIFAYLPIGIYFEERKLLKLYGEKYRVYKRNVPAIIPSLY